MNKPSVSGAQNRTNSSDNRHSPICRTCLGTEIESLQNIFETEINLVKIPQMLFNVTRIEVQENDILPKTICAACLDSLMQAYDFKRMCLNSHNELVSTLHKQNLLKKIEENPNQIIQPSKLLNRQYGKKKNKSLQINCSSNSANGAEFPGENSAKDSNTLSISLLEGNEITVQKNHLNAEKCKNTKNENREDKNDKDEKQTVSLKPKDAETEKASDNSVGKLNSSTNANPIKTANTELVNSIQTAEIDQQNTTNDTNCASKTVEISRQPLEQTISIGGKRYRLVRIKRKTTIKTPPNQGSDNIETASSSESGQSTNKEISKNDEKVNNKRRYSLLDLNEEGSLPISQAINNTDLSLSIKRVKSLALMTDVQKKQVSGIPMVEIPLQNDSSNTTKRTIKLKEELKSETITSSARNSENSSSSHNNANIECLQQQREKPDSVLSNKLEITNAYKTPFVEENVPRAEETNPPKPVLKPKINIIQNWSRPTAPTAKEHIHYCKQCKIRFSNSIGLVKHKISRHLDDIRPDSNQTKQIDKPSVMQVVEIVDISNEDDNIDSSVKEKSEVNRENEAEWETSSIEFIPDEDTDIIDLSDDNKTYSKNINSSESKIVALSEEIKPEIFAKQKEVKETNTNTQPSEGISLDEIHKYEKCTKCTLKLPVGLINQHTLLSHLLCTICLLPCKSITDLMQHIVDHENNITGNHEKTSKMDLTVETSNTFECKLCKQNCSNEQQLRNHEKLFHGCSLCEYKSKSIQNIKMHFTDHALKHLKCAKCDKSFKTKKSHYKHIQKSHTKLSLAPSEDFKKTKICEFCSKNYVTRTYYIKHLQSQHNVLRNESTSEYICSLCSLSFSNVLYFKRHNKRQHEKKLSKSEYYNEFILNKCMEIVERSVLKPAVKPNSSFKDSTLTTQNNIVDTNATISSLPSLLKSAISKGNENTKKEQNISLSLVSKNETNSFNVSKSSLLSTSTPSSETSHKIITSKKEVDKGMPTGNIEKQGQPWKYECEVCHRAFRTQEKYRFHMNSSHYNAQSQFCDICEKRFSERKHFQLHKLKHHGTRSCRECKKVFPIILVALQFNDKLALKEHLKEHHSQNIFLCDVHPCNESFIEWVDFKDHRKSSHPLEERNFCDICKRIFVSKAYLDFHMHKHNQEQK